MQFLSQVDQRDVLFTPVDNQRFAGNNRVIDTFIETAGGCVLLLLLVCAGWNEMAAKLQFQSLLTSKSRRTHHHPKGSGSVGYSAIDTSVLRAKSDTSEVELRSEPTPALFRARRTCQRVFGAGSVSGGARTHQLKTSLCVNYRTCYTGKWFNFIFSRTWKSDECFKRKSTNLSFSKQLLYLKWTVLYV